MALLCFAISLPIALTGVSAANVNSGNGGSSGGAGASRCWGSDTDTTKSGSSIILDCGNNNWGYTHILKKHMDGTIAGGSKFSKIYSPSNTLDIVMDVLNRQDKLVYQNATKTRASKEIYSTIERKNVKVVLHKGSNWSGMSNYDWVVITAYPTN